MHVTIRVRGAMGPVTVAAFDDLDVETETVLHGQLPDDSALSGVLNRLHNLNLRIIDVKVAPRIAVDQPQP
jgi:hypothetical protein